MDTELLEYMSSSFISPYSTTLYDVEYFNYTVNDLETLDRLFHE